jgi:hypothetical protein
VDQLSSWPLQSANGYSIRISPQQSYDQDKDAQKGSASGNAGYVSNDCVGIAAVIPGHEPARKQRHDDEYNDGERAHCAASLTRLSKQPWIASKRLEA